MSLLDTATIDELWDELQSRFNACILIYEQDGKLGNTCIENIRHNTSCSQYLGLIELAKAYGEVLKESYFQSTEEQ